MKSSGSYRRIKWLYYGLNVDVMIYYLAYIASIARHCS